MPYCSRCGVEVESFKTHCPLCQTEIQKLEDLVIEEKKKYPDEQVTQPKRVRTKKQKRSLAWELFSVAILVPLLITLFTDLIVNKEVSWSLYPVSTLLLVWIIVSVPIMFPKKIPILLVGETVPYIIYFLIIDLIDNGQIDWYPRLGLPIIALVMTTVLLVAVGSIFVKNKGANIAAFIIIGAGIICLGTDFIVTTYIRGSFAVSWSLYVLASTIVIGGFLLYIHYRIIKGSNLKRKLQM
jgi:hypothetical protein